MAVRVLIRTSARTTPVSASVCIIGAGIAGLVAATRLARDKKRKIVLVETGLKKLDSVFGALNEIEHPAQKYQQAFRRFRGLGGNSHLWDGKLLPLSPSDTLPRPYLDVPGWPFPIGELDRYLEEIETLLGVDRDSYEEDIAQKLDPQALLPRQASDICLRWPKRPSTKNQNLAYVFRKEIEELDNLEIWLGSTAAGFDFDAATGKIKTLKAVNQVGQTLVVTADEYLIAAGTLESTRMLLLADRQGNEIISRECRVLGRYFNDHLGLHAGIVRPKNGTLTNQMLSDRAQRHLHFELSPEAQKKNGIASAYLDVGLEIPDFSALIKSKKVLQSLKRGGLNIKFRDVKDIIADSPSLFYMAQWQWLRKQKYWPTNATLKIKIWAEQLPQWQNRLYLSDEKDALQLPMLKLDWDRADGEERTFRSAIATMDRYWTQHLAHICQPEWIPEALDPKSELLKLTWDLAHPAGSTRMGTSPADSVVDCDLRVHQIPNLSVASASVFPTSGSANPTLTIMQLALRATDAIAKRLPA